MQVSPIANIHIKPWRTSLKRLDSSQLDALYAYFSLYKHTTSAGTTNSTNTTPPPSLEGSADSKRSLILEVIEKKLSRGEKINLLEEFVEYFEQNGTWELIREDVAVIETEERRLSGGLSFQSSLDGLPGASREREMTDVTAATATSSSSSSLSTFTRIQTAISNIGIALQQKRRSKSKKTFILSLVMNIWMMWTTIFMPSLGKFNAYGNYGEWVMKVLNYPLTLSLDLISFEASVALSFVGLAIQFIYFGLLIYSFKSVSNSSKWSKLARNSSHICGLVVIFISLVIPYLMSGSLDCNYSKTITVDEVIYPVLKRFPTQPCHLTPNIIFYIIFIASIPFFLISVTISTMLVANLHPMNTSWFSMQHSFFKLSFNVVNCLSIFFHFLVPSEFAYGRAIIHIVLSIFNIYVFWRLIPYFKRVENSFYFACVTGRLGCAIGVLISSLVNPTDSSDLGLEMMGMTLGIILVCYLTGFITMEVYTRLVFRYVKDIFGRNSEKEKEFVMIYHFFEEKERLRYLQMFLRFALRSSHEIADLATSFVKAAAGSKSFNDPELLILGAMLAAYRWEDYGYSYAQVLIRRANRANLPYTIRFYLAERTRELEIDQTKDIYSGHNFVEIKHIVERVEKKTDELRSLHKHFWKELINEVPNMSKLDQVNRRMTSLTNEIENTYSNLMTNYSRERQVLRGYATFLENFKFDKDLAHELVQEVAKIEEEESLRVKRKSSGLNLPAKRKYESYIRKSIDDRPPPQAAEQVDESFSGIETQRDVSKKESLFRNAVRNGGTSKGILSSLVVFGAFTVGLFIYYLAFGVYISLNAGEHVSISYFMCKPSTSTIGLLREIRLKQNINRVTDLNPELLSVSPVMVNISLSEHKARISEYDSFFKEITKEAQQNRFTTELYQVFTKPNITIFIPSVPKDSSDLFFTLSDNKNVSVFELINIISESATYFKNWEGSDYNNTIQSFEFMYVWDNKLIARNSFVSFCESAIEANSDETAYFAYILNVSYGATAGAYLLISFIYLIVVRYQMAEVPHVLNIFKKNLSKNVVGKIYHEMNEKNDDDATTHLPKTSLSRPNNLFFVYGVLVILALLLVGALILIDSNENCSDSIQTSLNIKHGTSVLRVIHRASFRVGEYFAYLGFPTNHINSPYMTTQEEIQGFLSDIKALMSQLYIDWTSLVYGSGGSQVSVGKYSAIDRLIQGISSCVDNTTMDDATLVSMWQNCYGLERLISSYATDVSKFNEKVVNPNYVKDMENFFNEYMDIFVMTNVLSDHLIRFLNLFVENSSTPGFEITGVFSALFCAVCICLFYLMYQTLEYNRSQLMCLRNMLNYVPVDALDSNESIRNFILYNVIPSPFSKVFKKKMDNPSDENSKVRSVLNSSVEGAFIADENGFVELINPAAQNIFGFQQQSDVVGTPFINIFDVKDHEHIKKTIQNMKESMKSSNLHNHGEVVEVDCVRKNGTQFPAMVNMFIVIFDNSPNLVCFLKDVTSEKKHNAIIAEEKAKSDRLLRNILPESVAARLKSGDTFIAEKFADITCFFSDMVGFTNLSSGLNPNELVGMLNTIVNGFDALTDKYQLEKIKTIGDAYFAVGGIGNTQSDHPERTLRFSISTFEVIKDFNMKNPNTQINIRCGINTGGCVAGVIGTKKFAYDLWGDTINVASRMESNSKPGRIQISRSTFERVHDLKFDFEERRLDIKGKGLCSCYLLHQKHHENPIIEKKLIEDSPSIANSTSATTLATTSATN